MENTREFRLILRIDWSDLDLFGHVNNVAYFRFMQSARVECWKGIELYPLYESDNIGPMLVSANIDFKQPLFYPGFVHLHYKAAFIRNTSFGFTYSIQNQDGEECAAGHDAMVLYDFKRQEKLVIPEWMRLALNQMDE